MRAQHLWCRLYLWLYVSMLGKRVSGVFRWYGILPFVSVYRYVIVNNLCPTFHKYIYSDTNRDLCIRLFWEWSTRFAQTALSSIESRSSARMTTTSLSTSSYIMISPDRGITGWCSYNYKSRKEGSQPATKALVHFQSLLLKARFTLA